MSRRPATDAVHLLGYDCASRVARLLAMGIMATSVSDARIRYVLRLHPSWPVSQIGAEWNAHAHHDAALASPACYELLGAGVLGYRGRHLTMFMF